MSGELLMMVGGIGAFALTVYWIRNGKLDEKHAMIWLGVACFLLICGFFPQIIVNMAQACKLSYSSFVLFMALAAMYLCCFTFSVSLTRRRRHIVKLLQDLAIVEQRVRNLEAKVSENRWERNKPEGWSPPAQFSFRSRKAA